MLMMRKTLSWLGILVILVASNAGFAMADGQPGCNSVGTLQLCVAQATVRTHSEYPNGSRKVAASVKLTVKNHSPADLAISLAKEPLQFQLGGVGLSDLENRTGLVGIKRGDGPKDLITVSANQTHTIVFNFLELVNTNSLAPLGNARTGTFAAIFNVADANGSIREAAVSVAEFPVANDLRP